MTAPMYDRDGDIEISTNNAQIGVIREHHSRDGDVFYRRSTLDITLDCGWCGDHRTLIFGHSWSLN